MTKAGKVRQQTPRVESTGVNSIKKKIPRKRYRRLYRKIVLNENYGGQPDSIGAKKARYRS